MFSDEVRVRCRSCGIWVQKDSVPSCVEWCSQARECLGEQRWEALMGSRGAETVGTDTAGTEAAGTDPGSAVPGGDEEG
jgi:hypothetical protein